MLDIINIDFIKSSNELTPKNGSGNYSYISENSPFHDMLKNNISESLNDRRDEQNNSINKNNPVKEEYQNKKIDEGTAREKTGGSKETEAVQKESGETDTENKIQQKNGPDEKIENKTDENIKSKIEDKIDELNDRQNILPEELINNLLKLLDLLEKSPVEKNIKEVQELKKIISALKDLKFDNKDNSTKELVDKSLGKLKDLLENFKFVKTGEKINFKNLLASVKESLDRVQEFNKKIIFTLEPGKKPVHRIKNRENNEEARTNNINNINNQKSESSEILKSQLFESTGNEKNDSGNENNNQSLFNFNQLKNSRGINNSSIDGRQINNSKFRQQLNSILENAKVVVKDSKNGTFSVKLYPKALGNMRVNLGLEQGVISGKFLVESNEAKELLTQNLAYITDQLKEAGISVGSFEVNVSDQNNRFQDKEKNKIEITDIVEQEILVNEFEINSMTVSPGGINVII